MNIIVHYPKSEKDLSDLKKRVSDVHIEALISHINKLSCPFNQKKSLISELQNMKKNN